MHFFAQIKPSSYIHKMGIGHLRNSASIYNVMFKLDDGIYKSGELLSNDIEIMRAYPHIFKIEAIAILPERLAEIENIPDKDIDTSDISEVSEVFFEKATLKKSSRPKLKD